MSKIADLDMLAATHPDTVAEGMGFFLYLNSVFDAFDAGNAGPAEHDARFNDIVMGCPS